ncbi:MAG: copper amine oxidase N-terminal domain-containing protein [Cellulosilyticaceae bacterium]
MKKNNRIITGVLMLLTMVLLAIPVFAAPGPADVFINDVKQEVPVDMGQAFMDQDGRIHIPLRFIIEVMDNKLDWNPTLKQANINDGQIILTLNSKVFKTLDGESLMDTVPFLKDGRTYVPIRFVSEALGYEVKYKYIAGVNCVMIYGDKALTTPEGDADYRPGDVPTYDKIPGQGMVSEETKYFVGMTPDRIGLNNNNTILRTPGSTWDEERYYLNTLLGKSGVGFAKNGDLAIGTAESLKDTAKGAANGFVSIYPNRENTSLRDIDIRGWITKSNTNPTEMQIAKHNVMLEGICYYSQSRDDGKAIIAYLDKAFNSGKAPTFGKEMTFGKTKVKLVERSGYGLIVRFMN